MLKPIDDTADMASRVSEVFHEVLDQQVQKAIARRIHSKIRDARSDPDRAGRRWPFELIQNAHDAGERQGTLGISLSFQLDNGALEFQHDAAPFEIDDVAALLTGGSSKDFDSQ